MGPGHEFPLRRLLAGVLIVAAICLLTPQVPASPITKLSRGIYNVAFGWTEIVYRPLAEPDYDHEMKRLLVGVSKGTVLGVARTAVGAVEVATFPVTQPFEGEPVVYPEYMDYTRAALKVRM